MTIQYARMVELVDTRDLTVKLFDAWLYLYKVNLTTGRYIGNDIVVRCKFIERFYGDIVVQR